MLRKIMKFLTKIFDSVNLITINVALTALFLDQFVKFLIREKFFINESLPVIKNLFHVTFVRNYGAAMGFLKGQNNFLVTSALMSILLLVVYSQKIRWQDKYFRICLGLLLGGALGNLIDRISLGYVVDYFDIRFFPAIFNLADLFIDIGVFYLFVKVLKADENALFPVSYKKSKESTTT